MARAFAIEDSTLNKVSISSSRQKQYKDIDLSFEAKPSGEVYKKIDAAAVKQAVKNILLTNRFEKPFRPAYGADLRALLFELVDDPDVEDEIEEKVRNTLKRYEPRAEVLGIEVNPLPDNNTISIQVEFKVVNTEEIVTVTTRISRLR